MLCRRFFAVLLLLSFAFFTHSGRGDPGINAFAGYGTHNTVQLGGGYGARYEEKRR